MGSPRKDSSLKGINDSGDAPRRTVGEIAREKRLRDDPMAEVLGPLFVTCKRCGNRIKLSPKSLYDPFHWLKHRERCLKKPVGGTRATSRPSREIIVEQRSPASSSNTDPDNLTPPPSLTPNDDRQGIPAVVKESSSSPEPEEVVMDTSTKLDDLPLVDHGPWQSWSWSDLRLPAWLVDINHMHEDDGDDDEPPRVTIIERGSTPTLHPGTHPQDNS
ncbi:uncharacterized protein EDB93DRAFT_806732 [Suillus bovinus]|uniref:uncharacterized protein n=1 Tax=Suillus bovinus TaxID=48563 RepID=UPI001B867594|nr:uncharacterized protein EDB93DRAFT_806732 [Suillus bovinus]KAG2157680.1 hypothetical protein EDB93DRAFT_806732 [Suillus bovinus]